MNKSLLLLIVGLLAIAGCGVKSRDDGGNHDSSTPAVGMSAELPSGLVVTPEGKVSSGRHFKQEKVTSQAQAIFVSRTGKFVLWASNVNFMPRQDNTISYRIAANDLTPLPAGEYSLKVEYSMPSMEMEGLTSSSRVLPDGRTEVTYEGIAHGGEWEVRFSILRGSQVVDTVAYRVKVPNK